MEIHHGCSQYDCTQCYDGGIKNQAQLQSAEQALPAVELKKRTIVLNDLLIFFVLQQRLGSLTALPLADWTEELGWNHNPPSRERLRPKGCKSSWVKFLVVQREYGLMLPLLLHLLATSCPPSRGNQRQAPSLRQISREERPPAHRNV